MQRHANSTALHLSTCFSERMAKALPRILLDKEEGKKRAITTLYLHRRDELKHEEK